MIRAPEPPGAAIAIDRAERSAIVFTARGEPGSDDGDQSLLVDLGQGGRPSHSSELDIHTLAAAEFLGRLYLFDDRGLNRIDEGVDPATDDSTVAGLIPYPGTFRAESAAAGKRRMLAAGFDVAGILRIAEYDGVRMVDSEVPRPPGFKDLGGASGPARIAIAAIGDDRFVLALIDEKRVYAARFDGRPTAPEQIAWSPPESVRDARGLVLTVGPTGAAIAVERHADDGSKAVARFDLRVDVGAPKLVPRGEEPLAAKERLIGSYPAAGLQSGSPTPMIAGERRGVEPAGVRLLAPPDGEPEIPVAVAAWNVRESRFEGPLLIHLGLFMVLGLALRGRRETEARIVAYRPAPFLRRFLAFLIDAFIAMLLASVVLQFVLGAPEHSYLERFVPMPEIFASAEAIQDPIAILTLAEWFAVFVFLMMTISAVSEACFGQSLGKRLLGLSVVSLDGDRPTLGATFTRSALLFVELRPPFLGMIFVLFTSRRQRLGDIFAGTVVIERKSLTVRAATRQEVERGEP